TGSAVLPSLRVRPLTRTSRARSGSKDAEVPSKRRGSPLGLLSCGCLENAVAIHMGIMRSRYERSFLPIPPAGSFAYAFADRRLLCYKDWCSQPRFGAVLDGGFAGRASNTLTGRPQPHTGPTTAKSGRNVCLGQRRPRP